MTISTDSAILILMLTWLIGRLEVINGRVSKTEKHAKSTVLHPPFLKQPDFEGDTE